MDGLDPSGSMATRSPSACRPRPWDQDRCDQANGADTVSHPLLAAKVPFGAKPAPPKKATDADALMLAALLIESSDDAIIGMNAQSVIIKWNRSAQRLYGYPAAQVIGRNGSFLLPKDRLSELDKIQNHAATRAGA